MAAITNADVDTLVGTQAAPITRVTDVDTLFPATHSNRYMPIEFTVNSSGKTIYLTYEELEEDSIWEERVASSGGFDTILDDFSVLVDALKVTLDAYTAPYTYAEYKDVVDTWKNSPATRFLRGQF